MKWQHDFISAWHRVAALFGRRRRAREIDDELTFHLAMKQVEHQRAGRHAEDAALAARRQFGNVAVLKEQTNDMWTFPSLESFVQDIRYTFRTLRKAPGFSVVAIVVLAIGIGANTAMFSLLDAMMLRGLPYQDANRLVVLIGNVQRATVERRGNSWLDHRDWRAKTTQFDDMAAFNSTTTTLTGVDEPERISIETVSSPYFSLLGVSPAYGRTFRADEDQTPNADPYVVLSDGLWKRRFGGDLSILNHTVQLGGRSFTVLGIMPAGFTGLSDQAQLWIPFTMSGMTFDDRGNRGFQTLARLKKDATIDTARAELNVISKQLEQAYPATNAKRAVEVSPLSVETFGQLRPVVLTLMAAVTFVLLIACANVANLLIGRSESRQREIAVRTALGAGQRRLLRQLITESCVLTLIGAAAGIGLARLAVNLLITASPLSWPTFVQPALNLTVLGFTVGISLIAGVALGLAPAMHARWSRLTDSLKESARGSSSARSQQLRASLVVAEVALAIVLLAGAGLMIRSVKNLTAIDPGFDPSGVLTLVVGIPRQAAPTPSTGAPTPSTGAPTPPPPLVMSGQDVIDRVRAVPGVLSVSLASDIPLGPNSSASFYAAEGDTTTDAQTLPRAYLHRVSPEFFETLKMPMRRGRTFSAGELTPDSTVVVVSEGVVRRFWPNQDPLGKRIKLGPAAGQNPWMTIIGVVAETKYRGLPTNPTADPDLYFPWVGRSPQPVLIRAGVDPNSLIGAVRASLRQGQPGVVVYGISSMADLVAGQTSTSRVTTWLLGLFATTALVLSMIGIYGVMSYLVTLRRREFGIRLALGARRFEIVKVVLKQGARLIAIGTLIGIAGVAALSSLLDSLLYGVTSMDVASAAAILLLVVVAVLACAVPAFRATRVDPMTALRAE